MAAGKSFYGNDKAGVAPGDNTGQIDPMCLRWLRTCPCESRRQPCFLCAWRETPADLPINGRSGNSVQAGLARHVTRQAAQMALDGSSALALALLGRLLIELALARFSEHAGLFAGTLETTQCDLERLVLANFYVGHGNSEW